MALNSPGRIPGRRLSAVAASSKYHLLSLPAVIVLALSGCTVRQQAAEPEIFFTRIPAARTGDSTTLEAIEGRVRRVLPGQRIVLFARSDIWWVQPFSNNPFTAVGRDNAWKGRTHFGHEYAALLVEPSFNPPARTDRLPAKGAGVVAVAIVNGVASDAAKMPNEPRALRFSGYDWTIRQEPSPRGGVMAEYDPANVWLDDRGRLHLKITKGANGWKCAEIKLNDSLGYGTYSFQVQDLSHLEPAAVTGIYTYDDLAPEQNYREMNIEVSRWGEPMNKNAQFAVQPYYVPANVVRFEVPAGKLAYSLNWRPGRAHFRAGPAFAPPQPLADFSFTAGVPPSGHESLHIALYAYSKARYPLSRETEVVIERFDYIP